ncbi:MAG: peptidylprolyl isomerase [Parvularculaceae bacterium]|nr:peptidylprolyl isomerase [Parvularculaceae bacterium]
MKFLPIISAAAAVSISFANAEAPPVRKSSGEILAETSAEDWRAIPADETLLIELERGTITVALSPALAPRHVEQVRRLTREGFYDGLSFYRVIDGFVAQGGDPFGERKIRKAKKKMKAEFETAGNDIAFSPLPDSDGFAPSVGFVGSLPAGRDAEKGTLWHLHCAGAFAFGREDGADTASTEFYVALQPQRYLDRNLTVFGRVIDGMEHLQALRRVSPPETKDDDLGETIIRMRMASDSEAPVAAWEILDSARPVFADFMEARRNRPESFFHYSADHLDVCQAPVPVRQRSAE